MIAQRRVRELELVLEEYESKLDKLRADVFRVLGEHDAEPELMQDMSDVI